MVSQKYRWDFIGLSTDDKPTSETSDKVVNGSTYYCSDTSKLYVYCDGTWYERKPLGGGGGGGTSDFNDLSNRPKYNGTDMTGSTNIPEVVTYSDFTGTDGVDAGTSGLVPAPIATDTDKYLKSDGTWATVSGGGTTYTAGDGIDITNAVISATNTGKAKILTTNDYNYPTDNPTSVALWKLPTGIYSNSGSVNISFSLGVTPSALDGLFFIDTDVNNKTEIIHLYAGGTSGFYVLSSNGSLSEEYMFKIENNLTSTSTSRALSANQGKVLKDLIDALAIRDAGAPTTSTVGSVGTLYEDTTNGKLYICTDATNPYVWEEVGAGGGSGPTVVQTTGTSTTDVMSQNAVTSMVFADPATQYKIKIGSETAANEGSNSIEIGRGAITTGTESIGVGRGAVCSGDYAVSVGGNASSTQQWGVAVGAQANATAQGSIAIGNHSGYYGMAVGEMHIGTSATAGGYNNSNYRLLSGLYDGQSAHDAATVAQGNTLSTSAPTTSTVGVLGQLYTDTTNMHTYQCTAISGDTYTWTQRW